VIPGAVATRQTSTSGRPKSPRIQVVLPEELCDRLNAAAEGESRTVSNMAKVLIQQGLEQLERAQVAALARQVGLTRQAAPDSALSGDRFRQALERQEGQQPQRLRGLPRRLRLQRPGL
jgi:predicted DNA-binding protein